MPPSLALRMSNASPKFALDVSTIRMRPCNFQRFDLLAVVDADAVIEDAAAALSFSKFEQSIFHIVTCDPEEPSAISWL